MYKSVYYWNHCGLELWSSFFSGVIQNFLWLLFSMSQRVDYWYYCWVDHNCQYYWDTGKSVSSVKSPRNCKSWDPISWIHATTPRNFFRTHIKSDSDWISHICVCGLFLFVSSFCIPLLLWKPYFRMSVLKPFPLLDPWVTDGVLFCKTQPPIWVRTHSPPLSFTHPSYVCAVSMVTYGITMALVAMHAASCCCSGFTVPVRTQRADS